MRSLPCSLLASGALVACGPDIAEKHREWEAKAPDTYVVGVCSYGLGGGTCRLSVVERGQVVAAEQSGRADASWQPVAEPGDPIQALFQSIDDTSCDLEVEYDRAFSFPRHFWLDCGEEGYGETVECFVPHSLDLEACRDSTFFDP